MNVQHPFVPGGLPVEDRGFPALAPAICLVVMEEFLRLRGRIAGVTEELLNHVEPRRAGRFWRRRPVRTHSLMF